MARTKEFDETTVVTAAMNVFWDLGYDGASLPDILAATGLSRSSLYETFGDKRELFLRTVRSYSLQAKKRRLAAFNDPRGLVAGLSDYLHARLSSRKQDGCPGGCYLTSISATLKTADDELCAIVKQLTDESERDIYGGFARALAAGEISGHLTAQEWTELYLCFSWGLNVADRIGKSVQNQESMVTAFLSIIATKQSA